MDSGVEGVALLTIFVLSAFTGYEVISKVSTVLHTPLLSGANAIHGVILVGAILVAGSAEGTGELVVGLIAVTLSTINLVGGFVVTDRMLQMFRRGRPALAGGASGPSDSGSGGNGVASGRGRSGRGRGGRGRAGRGGKDDGTGTGGAGGTGTDDTGSADDRGATTQGADQHG